MKLTESTRTQKHMKISIILVKLFSDFPGTFSWTIPKERSPFLLYDQPMLLSDTVIILTWTEPDDCPACSRTTPSLVRISEANSVGVGIAPNMWLAFLSTEFLLSALLGNEPSAKHNTWGLLAYGGRVQIVVSVCLPGSNSVVSALTCFEQHASSFSFSSTTCLPPEASSFSSSLVSACQVFKWWVKGKLKKGQRQMTYIPFERALLDRESHLHFP